MLLYAIIPGGAACTLACQAQPFACTGWQAGLIQILIGPGPLIFWVAPHLQMQTSALEKLLQVGESDKGSKPVAWLVNKDGSYLSIQLGSVQASGLGLRDSPRRTLHAESYQEPAGAAAKYRQLG